MFNFSSKDDTSYSYKLDTSVPYVCNGFLVVYDTNNHLQFIRISSIGSIYFDSSEKCTFIDVIGRDSFYDVSLTPESVFDLIKDYLV